MAGSEIKFDIIFAGQVPVDLTELTDGRAGALIFGDVLGCKHTDTGGQGPLPEMRSGYNRVEGGDLQIRMHRINQKDFHPDLL